MPRAAARRLESGSLAEDEAQAYRRQAVKLHVRRAQARAQQGRLAEALADYDSALRCAVRMHTSLYYILPHGACVPRVSS